MCAVFVGLFGDEEFFNFGLELGVVLTVEGVFGDLLDGKGYGAIGGVLAGGVGDIREGCLAAVVFVDIRDDLLGEGGVSPLESIEEMVLLLHGFAKGAAVFDALDGGGEQVDSLCLLGSDVVEGVWVGQEARGYAIDESVEFFGNEGGHGTGCVSECIPVASRGPVGDDATANTDGFCDFGFGEVGLRIEVLRPVFLALFHGIGFRWANVVRE